MPPTDYAALTSLLGLQQKRQRDMSRNLELQQTTPNFYAGATQSDLSDVEEDMANNPNTGTQARADLRYNQPIEVEKRAETERNALSRLMLPEQMRGENAMAVERLRGDNNVRVAREQAVGRPNPDTAMDRYGPIQTLDPTTGMAMYTKRSEAAGLPAAGTGGERLAIKEGNSAIDLVQQARDMGSRTGYQGIGPTGGIKNAMYKYLGIGNADEDNLRIVMQKLGSDVMFGAGGKQLTTMEKKIASGYLADIYTNPTAADSKLAAIEEILTNNTRRRIGQPTHYQFGADPNAGGTVVTDPNWGR